jgi:outer membrane protein assembly factor BamB
MLAWVRPSRWPGRRRQAVAVLAALGLLATAGVVGYLVLAPAETLNPALGPYPQVTTLPEQRVGVLASAPLITDERLRVYAEKRRVWADAPITARHHTSPYWSLRRWPAQVVGVVEVAGDPPIVVTSWSDGVVVAINAKTGRIAWRTTTSAIAVDEHWWPTGAVTVYEPTGLATATSAADGRRVVFVVDASRVRAYDPASGALRWERPKNGCLDASTGESTYLLLPGCSASGALEIYDAGTGGLLASWRPPAATAGLNGGTELSPWDCAVGRSGCQLLRLRAGSETSNWRIGRDGMVTAEPYAGPDTQFALPDGFVASRPDSDVTLVDRGTGAVRWRASLAGYVIGANARGVYAITRQYDLIVLDPATGMLLMRLDLRGRDVRDWTAGHVYIHGQYVAIERLTGKAGDSDQRRFYGPTPILLMTT